MVRRALYCTADSIGTVSGGGVVTYNELNTLQDTADQVLVLERKDLKLLGPSQSPFLYDYFALQLVKEAEVDFELAHFYSGTFTETIRFLKSQGTKVSYTCPAHDRKVTVEEFTRQGLEYPYLHIKDDTLWSWFSAGLHEANVIIAPSNLAADFLKAEGCQHVEVIPHGCKLPAQTPHFPAQFKVGYLGQVGPDKGVSYLLQAWSKLNYQGSVLILAGRGTKELETYITQNTNGGVYQLLGFVNSPQQLYEDCSVYVQPSVCESFGIEILEAMAHGRPVIASQGAGASALIEDGVTGFTVPIRDSSAIAERIDWFKKNPSQVPVMGERAREKASQFTWEEIRREYKQIWTFL